MKLQKPSQLKEQLSSDPASTAPSITGYMSDSKIPWSVRTALRERRKVIKAKVVDFYTTPAEMAAMTISTHNSGEVNRLSMRSEQSCSSTRPVHPSHQTVMSQSAPIPFASFFPVITCRFVRMPFLETSRHLDRMFTGPLTRAFSIVLDVLIAPIQIVFASFNPQRLLGHLCPFLTLILARTSTARFKKIRLQFAAGNVSPHIFTRVSWHDPIIAPRNYEVMKALTA